VRLPGGSPYSRDPEDGLERPGQGLGRGVLVAVLGLALAAGIFAASEADDAGRSAQAAPQSSSLPFHLDKPLDMTADQVTVDNGGAVLVASGHVSLTSGADRATSDVLRLDRVGRSAQLIGHVIVTSPRGKASGDTVTLFLSPANQVSRVVVTGNAAVETAAYALSAGEIIADRTLDQFVAEGRVKGFAAPDLALTAERVMYTQRREYALITGHPVVTNKMGRLTGEQIELFRLRQEAVVRGPVKAEVYGATLTGDAATADFRKSVIVVSGHVVIARRQGTLWADRVTIFYQQRRLIAQGTTHMQFRDVGGSAGAP
jgi:lipopolysaccharide export system protein LptA